MKSLKELFRTGLGPSSSHTMGPNAAAKRFREMCPDASKYAVTLYGSLAATGKGHMTDLAITDVLGAEKTSIEWKPDEVPVEHPNGMKIEAFDGGNKLIGEKTYFSVGGGAIKEKGGKVESPDVYPINKMSDLLAWCHDTESPLWKYVEVCEGKEIWDFLSEVWNAMQKAIANGLDSEGALPGGLKLPRKSHVFYRRARRNNVVFQRTGLLSAYALAVAEENAGRGIVVTAPTCGSCGVIPAVLKYIHDFLSLRNKDVLRALATAGIVGNFIKTNASISGAEAGCQAEIGTACSMAAAAGTEMMGGSPRQIEYAAEMGMEHYLGLTCDPVAGLVQIPCIERNAAAAARAVDCADYALLSDGTHHITFDEVVETMRQTGLDIKSSYRETSQGGLAKIKIPMR